MDEIVGFFQTRGKIKGNLEAIEVLVEGLTVEESIIALSKHPHLFDQANQANDRNVNTIKQTVKKYVTSGLQIINCPSESKTARVLTGFLKAMEKEELNGFARTSESTKSDGK